MQILRPDDSQYDSAATTFMGQKGTPQVIYKPTSEQEVSQAVKECVAKGLTISIKSGGHSNSGFSTNDEGAIIDMADINSIDVIDEDQGIVRIGSGAVWGTVAEKLGQHGLALSSGDTKTVGVGGLTTGGGIGWMVRQYGLTIDSMISVEIVTAEGNIHTVDKERELDLFWAIRGGGGNFGVVTYFTFRAHRITDVYAGTLTYDTSNVSQLLTSWHSYMQNVDTRLTTIVTILPAFGEGKPMVLVGCCFAGDNEKEAHTVIEPLRHLGTLVKDDVVKKKYHEVLEEAHPPQGMKIIVNNTFFDMNQKTINAIEEARHSKPDLILQIRSLGGAMAQVPQDATAFAHRTHDILIVCPTFLSPTATPEETTNALSAWESLSQIGIGHYGNLLSPVGQDITHGMYPDNTYKRLAKIKKQYDPRNIFCHTHNILPD